MKKVVLILSFIFIVCSPVYGYLPDSPFLLKLVVEKIGKPDRISVEQELEIFNSAFENGIKIFQEQLRYNLVDSFRSDTKSKDKTKIYVYSNEASIKILDSQISSELESLMDSYKDILLIRDSELIFKKLKSIGIDMFVSSLGRFNNRLSYIIGAKNNDFSVSQLWVDKESLCPTRLIIIRDSSKLEIRYFEWKRLRRTWYPRRIEFFESDVLTRIVRVKKVVLNPIFKKNIFDIEFLKSVYEKEKIDIKDKDDEVTKTIEKFDKRF
jgi:outer membrane lipoprotein-sorting protein